MSFNTIKVNNTDTNYTHSIFDISEYTGKTYDTLSDALTDVPDGKQKGGMTISFVLNSDNKYVQFRLMADEWSTNESDWQGVDTEPVADSKNLVESGGVEKLTTKVKDSIDVHLKTLDFNSYTFQDGYILGLTTTKTWSTRYGSNIQHIIIPIADLNGVSKITVVSGDADTTSWAFLSSYDVVDGASANVVTSGQIVTGHNKSVVNVPTTANYLYLAAKNYQHPNILPALVIISDDMEDLHFNSGEKLSETNISASISKGSTALVKSDTLFKRFNQDESRIEPLYDGSDYSVINLANYNEADGYINTQGVWASTTNVKHVVIPVGDFDSTKGILIKVGSHPVTCCWLSEYNVVIGGDAGRIPDTLKSNISANSEFSITVPTNAAYLYFFVNPNTNNDIPERVSQGTLYKMSDKADKGVLDSGTTYNNANKQYSNRIGNAYRIKDLTATYYVSLKDVNLTDSNKIFISLLKAEGFTSSYITHNVTTAESNGIISFTVPEQYRTSTNYIGVYIYNSTSSTDTQSFKAEVWYGDSLASALKEIDKNAHDIETIESDVAQLQSMIGVGGSSYDNAIYERKAIIEDAPYYMNLPVSPSSYNEDYYLEQKVKSIPKDCKSFIFITDTHLFMGNTSTKKNTRHSDLLMSYIKKRCGIDVGVFGGDCFDFNDTKYLAAGNLSDYASEFFSVFGKDGLWVQGNHDNNSNAVTAQGIDADVALISDEEAYRRTVRNIEDAVVFDTLGITTMENIVPSSYRADVGWWMKMHYYKDDPLSKTRYIILESGDNSYGNGRIGGYYGSKWVQMDFVASALQNIPEDYNAVIAFHMCGGLESGTRLPIFGYQDTAFMSLISAYKTGSSITLDIMDDDSPITGNTNAVYFWRDMNVAKGGESTTTRSFDFSSSIGNRKVLVITGHFHNDAVFVGCTINGTYGIYRTCEHSKTNVKAYSNTSTYAVGNEVIYDNSIYVNKTAINSGEEFDASKWISMLDKDALPSDAVYMLWRNRDAYNGRFDTGSIEVNTMTPNTVNEQSFDVFTIKENDVVITKIGKGEDIELPL